MHRDQALDRFHRVLVEEIRAKRPDLLDSPFTVAEIYQDLVPYRTHRDVLGVEMNGDYEHLLLRLLAGEGGFLVLESEVARRDLRKELQSSNPNTGIFREYAAADVRLDTERLPEGSPVPSGPASWSGDENDTVPVESLAPSSAEAASAGLHEAAASAAEPTLDTRSDWMDREMEMEMEMDMEVEPEARETEAAAAEAAGDDVATCRWCREALPNREHLKFCPFCGTDVHVVPCPSCGEELEPAWRFCIACGTEVVAD